MTALWTASEIAAAVDGRAAGDWQANGVSIDSRTLEPGDLFVALEGPTFDGHEFVGAALAKGAAGALVARRPDGIGHDAPLVLAADTQAALEALGRASRARSAAKIVGVTGSVGKTGTKEALRRAFEAQGKTFASAGSLNNHWGVPLSLSRLPRNASFGVFEMGMNHPGEIDGLTRQVQPHVAVITTIEPAHLGFFASVEAIADAKAEIFNGMGPDGVAVLNRDNPHFARLAAAARSRGVTEILAFGEHQNAEFRLLRCVLRPTGSAVTASISGRKIEYNVSIPGRHWVMNSLAVLGAVKATGADVSVAAMSLGSLAALDGRGRRHRLDWAGSAIELIDESYNASPASMRAAFAVLATAEPGDGGRRIAVLGDMRELGAASRDLHAALAGPLLEAGTDLVFTVGHDMLALHEALPPERRGAHAETAIDMADVVARALRAGDVVTVKGSFGSRMREVVKRLLAEDAAPRSLEG
jgi:UDP-N-acetylmuramoyl-tripeptide--D-alanyl-D-alanine ligase